MTSRKTDPNKWDDHWFSCEIENDDQRVFQWLCDRCSSGGWIEENLRKMAFELRMEEKDIQASLIRIGKKPERGEPKYYHSTDEVLREYFNSTDTVLPEYYGWVANHIKVQENTTELNVKNTFHKGRLKDLLRFPGIIELAAKYYTGLPSSSKVLTEYFSSTTVVQDKRREGKVLKNTLRQERESEGESGEHPSRSMTKDELKGKHPLYDKVLDCCDLRNSFTYETFCELRQKWPDGDVDWHEIIEWVTKLHLGAAPGSGVDNAYLLISSVLKKGRFRQNGAADPNLTPELADHRKEEQRINAVWERSEKTDEDAKKCEEAHAANDRKHGVKA
jgi:hypothetical protein